jgi:2-polyprenyl-3-methyl-5-hydroxy-6-metoxy-1,4-benzoquinol methylase
MVNEKQKSEIEFWKNLYSSKKDYKEFRKKDAEWKLSFFKDKIKGKVLDVGCGLVSVMEGLENETVAIDPLVPEYKEILKDYKHEVNVSYLPVDGENIDINGKFDTVLCINVLDHTPEPIKMLKEINKKLKKNGFFLFQVNWDNNLSVCHYSLFDMDKTNELLHLGGFEVLEVRIDEMPGQLIFNAICRKYQS